MGDTYLGDLEGKLRYTKVVLTVAHLNHDTMDCRDENLLALCQRCHLSHDSDLHRTNARSTREAKKKQLPIQF